MGQTQFIPSNYLATAVDEDGDGKRDIWGSAADALASAGQPAGQGRLAARRGLGARSDPAGGLRLRPGRGPARALAGWAARGVRRADGLPWTAADAGGAGAADRCRRAATGPAFLALPNHFAIRTYNNSTAYALGVGLLADRFAGGGRWSRPGRPSSRCRWPTASPPSRPWPGSASTPAQPDGVIGAGTRTALRDWQKARGLPADGYLSIDLVKRLSLEAANAASGSADALRRSSLDAAPREVEPPSQVAERSSKDRRRQGGDASMAPMPSKRIALTAALAGLLVTGSTHAQAPPAPLPPAPLPAYRDATANVPVAAPTCMASTPPWPMSTRTATLMSPSPSKWA